MIIWTAQSINDYRQIHIQYGELDGVMQMQIEDVEVNQSGRSQQDQCILRMQSRASKKLDIGYRYSIPEAESMSSYNAAGLLRPMLAKKLSDIKNIDLDSCAMQYKYNGHRCLITNQGGEYIAYSRNGKPITTIDHILNPLTIEEGSTIDGELYIHGMSLQKIGSLVKKKQPESSNLVFVAFDYISDDVFSVRRQKAFDLFHGNKYTHIDLAPTIFDFGTQASVNRCLFDAKQRGYEGLILRTDNSGYEPGVRSKSLIKIKSAMDDEFLVVDIIPSVDDWGILVCEIGQSEQTFKVNAPGTIENKRQILHNKQDYIGRYINVEFFEWTDEGKPFHPVAIYWRDDDD